MFNAQLKNQLSGVFVNKKGEICKNLATSSSQVAVDIRRRQKIAKLSKQIRDLNTRIRTWENRRDQVRKQGLQLGGDKRTRLFRTANELHNKALAGKRKVSVLTHQLKDLRQ
jgi:outer membrane murein-binding lipoprotein Lpp